MQTSEVNRLDCMTYLASSEHKSRLHRATNPALVLSIAPLCFIDNSTCRKWPPMSSSCLRSSMLSEHICPSMSTVSHPGKGTFLVTVPKRRLTCQLANKKPQNLQLCERKEEH